MSGKKNQKGKSLRVDWIESVSYVGKMETCMYAGVHKKEVGMIIDWRQLSSLKEALAYKGNTGSASIYVIMEKLFHSDKLKQGRKILFFIPESGRFSMAYVLLTVV